MIKSKILKMVSKRASKFKGLKKFKTTYRSGSKGIYYKDLKIPSQPSTKASVYFGNHTNGKYWDSPLHSRISSIKINDGYEGKGLGTQLTFEALRSMKGKLVFGEVVSKGQIKIRSKFPNTTFHNRFTKKQTGKGISAKRSMSKLKEDDWINSYTKVPKEGIKKHINKSTGKVKFIRVRGRIVPIRSKK